MIRGRCCLLFCSLIACVSAGASRDGGAPRDAGVDAGGPSTSLAVIFSSPVVFDSIVVTAADGGLLAEQMLPAARPTLVMRAFFKWIPGHGMSSRATPRTPPR
jgi:hypothetical protein